MLPIKSKEPKAILESWREDINEVGITSTIMAISLAVISSSQFMKNQKTVGILIGLGSGALAVIGKDAFQLSSDFKKLNDEDSKKLVHYISKASKPDFTPDSQIETIMNEKTYILGSSFWMRYLA